MRKALWFLAVALLARSGDLRADRAPAVRTFAFDGDPAGAAPAGFSFARSGSGKPGRWVIKADPTAPSGKNVLAQLDADATDFRFPVAVASGPLLADGRVSVKCKPISGNVDRACGIVFRYRDADNYYVTRANALEGNVRLYYVKGGKRQQIASWRGKVTAGVWHSYQVEFQGDHIQVSWEGTKVLDHRDRTFQAAGKIGLWTKADSVTYFDDLTAAAL